MPFHAVTGHHRQLGLLRRAVQRERVPQALLLAGPAGIGKRRVAVALAQAMNCLAPVAAADGVDACGACSACTRIARGVHPDVIVLEPGDSGSIKIDTVREAIERTAYRPFEGRRRVVVVDDADALVVPAQHALLKTLEEPPPASVIVLVSARPDTLLATVRSRCSRLRFGPLSAPEVEAVLVRDHGVSPADARVAAADAHGSVGRALQAEAADLAAARDAARELLAQAARVADPSRRIEAGKALSPSKRASGEERAHLAACLRSLSSMLRDVGLLAAEGDRALLANPDLADELDRLAPRFPGSAAARAFLAVDEALGALDRNASPKIVADWLVLRL